MTKSPEFLPETMLEEELDTAMKRVGALGITYPDGYLQELIRKYSSEGILYPYILRALGKPRIKNHFFYTQALQRSGKFLDYGCGTGDNVRQLIRDGYKKENIFAFDLNWSSIDMGFDLYCDRDTIGALFMVSDSFPFIRAEFDTIYSGSVFHIIDDEDEIRQYLTNASNALRPGGILFGSTLGSKYSWLLSIRKVGPLRLMQQQEMESHLTEAGFSRPKIIRHKNDYHKDFDRICTFEFSAQKTV
jgi:SAM-dependent methyltransferase